MQPLAASSGLDTRAETPDSHATVWRVHLVREDPGKAVGIVAAALLGAAGGLVLFHNLLLAIFAAVLLLISVAEFLLPLTFTLDRTGAKVSCGPVEWLSMEWKAVRSAYRTSYGIKLSPFADPKTARMENCRGIRLRVPHALLAEAEASVGRFREDGEQ